jgi:fumarate reductase flavoprotein subunit
MCTLENKRFDVIIVGAGGAGLAAAAAAAERKKNVAIMEKRSAPGGNAAMAGALFAAESPAQKRQNIETSKDNFFKTAMTHAHWRIDPGIVRTVINRSGETIQWLEEKGLFFEVPVFYDNLPRTAHVADGHGAGIVNALVRYCEASGVRIFYNTPVLKIIPGEMDGIEGVVVLSGGQEQTLFCKSVIIASGGYAGNQDMLKRYYSHYSEALCVIGLPHDGDGLRMAMEIGAENEGLGNLHLRGPYFRGAMECVVAAMQPHNIWVNRNGRRFVDEGKAFYWSEAANALNRQPDRASFSLFDETLKTSLIHEGVTLGYNRFRRNSKLHRLSERIEKEMDRGMALKADSLSEVADFIGANPNVLESTVLEYNTFCKEKYDPLFLKDKKYLKPIHHPPFYALKCGQGFFATIGGIKINEKMEVVHKGDVSIKGVYAAGNDTGGWEAETYCLDLPGMALGFAIISGRIAGENAATLE